MKVWPIVQAAVAVVAVTNGTWSTYRAERSRRHVLRAGSPIPGTQPTADRQLYVVLPVLNEADRVVDSVRHWQEHLESHPSMFLCVLTTERERPVSGSAATTWGALESDAHWQSLSTHRRAFRLHYPRVNRTYGEQLSWGIDQVSALGASDAYVYVTNVDSRLAGTAVREVLECVAAGIPVAQQSTLFLRNLDACSWLAAGEALYQSRWTLEVEMFRYLAGGGYVSWLPRAVASRWYQHAVGHGLLAAASVIQQLDGFPTPTYGLEDAAFGLRLRAAGLHLHPLSSMEWGEAPTDSRELARQRRTWVRGPLAAIEYAQPTKRYDLALQGLWDGAKWSLGLPVLTSLVLVLRRPWRRTTIGGLALGMFGPLVVLLLLATRPPEGQVVRLEARQLVRAVSAYPMASLSYWLGGFLGALRLAGDVASGREFLQSPTRSRV